MIIINKKLKIFLLIDLLFLAWFVYDNLFFILIGGIASFYLLLVYFTPPPFYSDGVSRFKLRKIFKYITAHLRFFDDYRCLFI